MADKQLRPEVYEVGNSDTNKQMEVPPPKLSDKDMWDKCDIILKAVVGILTPLAVAVVGIVVSIALDRRQANETRFHLYSQLMSGREQSESQLRKDMFQSISKSFLETREKAKMPLEDQVLNLELLAYNFHDSLVLEPLFKYILKQIDKATPIKNSLKNGTFGPKDTKPEITETQAKNFRHRIRKAAQETNRKQLGALQQAENSKTLTVDLSKVAENDESKGVTLTLGDNEYILLKVALKGANGKTTTIEKTCKITVIQKDSERQELKVRLEVLTPPPGKAAPIEATFWVGFFDFPMVDNTRLPDDLRCALVLNNFVKNEADVTLICFPGSHASLKDKPYYQEILDRLQPYNSEHSWRIFGKE